MPVAEDGVLEVEGQEGAPAGADGVVALQIGHIPGEPRHGELHSNQSRRAAFPFDHLHHLAMQGLNCFPQLDLEEHA